MSGHTRAQDRPDRESTHQIDYAESADSDRAQTPAPVDYDGASTLSASERRELIDRMPLDRLKRLVKNSEKGSSKWTAEDIARAQDRLRSAEAQQARRKHAKKRERSVRYGESRSGKLEIDATSGDTTRESSRTHTRPDHTTTDTASSTFRPGASSPRQQTRQIDVSDADGVTTRRRVQGVNADTGAYEVTEEKTRGDKARDPNAPKTVQGSSDIATTGDKVQADWKAYKKEYACALGTLTVEFSPRAASAEYAARAGANTNGLVGGASAGAKAQVGSFKASVVGKPIALPLIEEDADLIFYLGVEGHALGIEAAGTLEAAIGSVANQAPKPITAGDNKPINADKVFSLAAGGGGEAFAGAKIGAKAGAKIDWKKKPQSAYVEPLGDAASLIVALVAGGLAGPAAAAVAAFLMDYCGVDELAGHVFSEAITWGAPGPSTLVQIEGMLEGSIGAGIKGEFKGGLANNKLTLSAGAGVTVGFGGSAGVLVSLDILQGPLFLLVSSGQIAGALKDWLGERIEAAWSGGLPAFLGLDSSAKLRQRINREIAELNDFTALTNRQREAILREYPDIHRSYLAELAYLKGCMAWYQRRSGPWDEPTRAALARALKSETLEDLAHSPFGVSIGGDEAVDALARYEYCQKRFDELVAEARERSARIHDYTPHRHGFLTDIGEAPAAAMRYVSHFARIERGPDFRFNHASQVPDEQERTFPRRGELEDAARSIVELVKPNIARLQPGERRLPLVKARQYKRQFDEELEPTFRDHVYEKLTRALSTHHG